MKTQDLAGPRLRGESLPQPLDAPLLTFQTAAAYLGTTPDGIRAALKTHLFLAAARVIHEKAVAKIQQVQADAEKRIEARILAGEWIEELDVA